MAYGIRLDGTLIAIVGFELVEVTDETDLEGLHARWKTAQAEEERHQLSLDETERRSVARVRYFRAEERA